MDRVFAQDRIERIANEIVRRTNARKDYVAPRGKLGVTLTDSNELALTLADKTLPFTRPALLQLAGSLDMPTKTVSRLQDAGHPDLVAALFSELLSRETLTPKGEARKHLVRELDGQVDGFLSDRFKTISNDAILAIVLEESKRVKAEVYDFRLTDTHFHVHLIAPGLRARVEHAMPEGSHAWAKGLDKDYHNAAVTIGNSENGHGRFFGDLSLWREVCSNFAIVQKGVARVHLGARMDEGEHLVTSDETKQLEDEVLTSKLRDVIRTAFDPVKFKALIDSVSATTARTIESTGVEVGAVEVVDATIKAFGLDNARRDSILENFLKAGKTQYALAQAVTEQVNPNNAGDLGDADRTNFEQAGGSLLAMKGTNWRTFIANSVKKAKEELEREPEMVVVRR